MEDWVDPTQISYLERDGFSNIIQVLLYIPPPLHIDRVGLALVLFQMMPFAVQGDNAGINTAKELRSTRDLSTLSHKFPDLLSMLSVP
jgi:hypothetical protein